MAIEKIFVENGTTITKKINEIIDKVNSKLTADDIAAGAITSEKIAPNAVTETKIADKAVSARSIEDNAVVKRTIADDSVSTEKLQNGAVVAIKIASRAVGTTKIATGAVTNSKIGTEAITSDKLDVLENVTIKQITGGNDGQGSTKYIVLDNTTVNGDLDVKGNTVLGSGQVLSVSNDLQTIESAVPIDFANDVYYNPDGSVFIKKSASFNIETDLPNSNVGRKAIVLNANTDGTTSIKVTFGFSPYQLTITVPPWCCMEFVKTPAVGDQVSFWRPLFGTR